MKSTFVIILVTIYLMVFSILCATGTAIYIIPYLFAISPVLVVAMVLTVLTDNTHAYPELGAGEEWGYADQPKDQLGVF